MVFGRIDVNMNLLFFRFFQYQQGCTKGSQSFAIVPFASNQQWCVHQIEQSHHQHVAYCWTIHYMGIPELEIRSRARLQTWLCQGKHLWMAFLHVFSWCYVSLKKTNTFLLRFENPFLTGTFFFFSIFSTRDNVCQSPITSPSNVNWSAGLTSNVSKIWYMKFSPLVQTSNTHQTSCGRSNWTHQTEDGARRTTITSKVVISVTEKIKSTFYSDVWFKPY